jgi:hypothetical protein
MQSNRVLLAHRDPAVQELATRALSRLGVTIDIGEEWLPNGYTVVVTDRNDALLAAVAAATPRPMVIVTAPVADQHTLDPQLVSLFVPEPYDAGTLVGVILACVTPEMQPPAGPAMDGVGSRQ